MAIARNKRRIMLTVPVEVAEELDRLRQSTGMATSSYLAQLLRSCLPALQAMADAAELAARKQDPSAALEGLRSVLGMAGTQLELAQIELADGLKRSPLGTKPGRAGRARTGTGRARRKGS